MVWHKVVYHLVLYVYDMYHIFYMTYGTLKHFSGAYTIFCWRGLYAGSNFC